MPTVSKRYKRVTHKPIYSTRHMNGYMCVCVDQGFNSPKCYEHNFSPHFPTNVAYVPELATNFFSITKVMENSFEVSSKKNIVRLSKGSVIIKFYKLKKKLDSVLGYK
jgi:hypothetical protein